MAKFNLNNYTNADGLGFPLNFRRGNPNPLDNSSVWASFEAAHNYAATDPVAYVGQILTVVDNENNTATVYSIQDEAGNLKKVGTSLTGDESTIVVAENGTVSLYGVDGLQLTRQEDDGSVTKINYQPLLVDGKLTWIEPSATTVEGLATEIEGLKTRISAAEATIGDASSGLVKNVANNTATISAINIKIGAVTEGKTVVEMISDAQAAATYDDTTLVGRVSTIESDYLKGADKTALEAKITEEATQAKTDAIAAIMGEAGIDEKYDTLKEIADWILSDTTASAQLITRVTTIESDYLKGTDKTALQDEIDALETFVGTLPEGAASTTVVAYIKEVVDALKIGDYAKASELTALTTRVKALEDIGAEKNVVATVDENQFAIDEARKLTLLNIAMGKVTGLTDALADKVSVETGKSLVANDEITKLTGVEAGAQVNKLESIKLGGTVLDINEKSVNIPVATTTLLGAVMSSTAQNKVAVNTDGTMEVNSLNVNKLMQTEGEYLILDGGASA